VRTRAELVEAANASLVDSFRKLVHHMPAGEIRDRGGIFAFTTGLPISLFNGCVAVEPTMPSEFHAAVDWIDSKALPNRTWIDEQRAPGILAAAVERGFVRDPVPYPGMVLEAIPEPPAPPDGVSIVAVTRESWDEHLAVRVGAGLSPDLARRLFPLSFAEDPDVRLFTVRLDGQPVGASAAIRTGHVGGVYAVGTLEPARRRGVGTAASWAAVAAIRSWGCDTAVLQASEMGYGVYRAMGFRTIVPYATLKRGLPPS
jgi:GNAT superfamily N-acetyltransferase